MDRGTDACNLLLGNVIPLRLGYVGVINRSQEDINAKKSVKDALTYEEAFFRSRPVYHGLADRCGIPQLAKKLNSILVQHIRLLLPDLKARINAQMVAVHKELVGYGEAAERATMGVLLLNILTKYSQSFVTIVDGKNQGMSTAELAGGARIHYIFQSIFVKCIDEVDPCEDLSDEDIRTAIQNATGTKNALFVPDVPFEVLVRRQISRLLDPSLQCARFVYDELVKIAHRCESYQLARFPVLRRKVEETVGSFLREGLTPAETMIRHLIDMEMDYINTSHPSFIGGSRAVEIILQQMRDGKGSEGGGQGAAVGGAAGGSLIAGAAGGGGSPSTAAVASVAAAAKQRVMLMRKEGGGQGQGGQEQQQQQQGGKQTATANGTVADKGSSWGISSIFGGQERNRGGNVSSATALTPFPLASPEPISASGGGSANEPASTILLREVNIPSSDGLAPTPLFLCFPLLYLSPGCVVWEALSGAEWWKVSVLVPSLKGSSSVPVCGQSGGVREGRRGRSGARSSRGILGRRSKAAAAASTSRSLATAAMPPAGSAQMVAAGPVVSVRGPVLQQGQQQQQVGQRELIGQPPQQQQPLRVVIQQQQVKEQQQRQQRRWWRRQRQGWVGMALMGARLVLQSMAAGGEAHLHTPLDPDVRGMVHALAVPHSEMPEGMRVGNRDVSGGDKRGADGAVLRGGVQQALPSGGEMSEGRGDGEQEMQTQLRRGGQEQAQEQQEEQKQEQHAQLRGDGQQEQQQQHEQLEGRGDESADASSCDVVFQVLDPAAQNEQQQQQQQQERESGLNRGTETSGDVARSDPFAGADDIGYVRREAGGNAAEGGERNMVVDDSAATEAGARLELGGSDEREREAQPMGRFVEDARLEVTPTASGRLNDVSISVITTALPIATSSNNGRVGVAAAAVTASRLPAPCRNIQDAVPKAIMHFLVNHVKRELHSVFIQQLYREALFEEMLQEREDIASKRQRCKDIYAVLQQAAW
ncbi:unnamed protein product, partial [Closterium sp. NIES-54]